MTDVGAYSYTRAAGKRPRRLDDGRFYWYSPSYSPGGGESTLDRAVFWLLRGGSDGMGWVTYDSESEAITSADKAAERAIIFGTYKPITDAEVGNG